MWLEAKLANVNTSTENSSLELAVFFLFFKDFSSHGQLWLVNRTKTKQRDVIQHYLKSHRAVEKSKFWVNGTESEVEDLLVKKKKKKRANSFSAGPPSVSTQSPSLFTRILFLPASRIYCYINSLLRRKHKLLINLLGIEFKFWGNSLRFYAS